MPVQRSLAQTARAAAADPNQTTTPHAVQMVETLFSGVSTLSVPHHPVYHAARLAALQKADGTFLHRHRFPLVTMSGKNGSAEDIFYAVYVAQALAQPGARVIVNGMEVDSPAFRAWSRLLFEDVIRWEGYIQEFRGEKWAVGVYKNVDKDKAATEYVTEVLTDYLGVGDSPRKYFMISAEREDELRQHYTDEKRLSVENVTTVFLAMALKVLHPRIACVFSKCENEKTRPTWEKGQAFFQNHVP